MVCCMPDLLLRRFTALLATSRVITLVATLLLVTVGGLYLLHLEALSNVLILGSAVLLARLDLARIRIAPAPPLLAALLALLVLGGAGLGHWLSLRGAPSILPLVPRSPEAVTPPPPSRQDRRSAVPARARPGGQPPWRAPLFGRVREPARSP
jgi:hypothetical protein